MPRKKILLIDDSETVLLQMKLVLEPHYDVVTAMDGSTGLDMARAERPDLILLDLVLPHMTGVKVVQTLRAEDANRWTPIVMMTGLSEMQSMAKGNRLGASGYLTKPIEDAQLLLTVRRMLGEESPPESRAVREPVSVADPISVRRQRRRNPIGF